MTAELERNRNIALAKLATWFLVVGILVAVFALGGSVRVAVVLLCLGLLGGVWREAMR